MISGLLLSETGSILISDTPLRSESGLNSHFLGWTPWFSLGHYFRWTFPKVRWELTRGFPLFGWPLGFFLGLFPFWGFEFSLRFKTGVFEEALPQRFSESPPPGVFLWSPEFVGVFITNPQGGGKRAP